MFFLHLWSSSSSSSSTTTDEGLRRHTTTTTSIGGDDADIRRWDSGMAVGRQMCWRCSGTWRCRYSATSTATTCTCLNATAAFRDVIRRSSRKHRLSVQSINQFNSNLAAQEPDSKRYAVEIIKKNSKWNKQCACMCWERCVEWVRRHCVGW